MHNYSYNIPSILAFAGIKWWRRESHCKWLSMCVKTSNRYGSKAFRRKSIELFLNQRITIEIDTNFPYVEIRTEEEEEKKTNKYRCMKKEIPCIVCTKYGDSMEYLLMKNALKRKEQCKEEKNEKHKHFQIIIFHRNLATKWSISILVTNMHKYYMHIRVPSGKLTKKRKIVQRVRSNDGKKIRSQIKPSNIEKQ